MARPKENIEEWKKQVADLQKKIREASEEQRKKEQEDARKKAEIAGNLALATVKADPTGNFAVAFRELLEKGVVRPTERALFDLTPMGKPPTDDATTEAVPKRGRMTGRNEISGRATPAAPPVRRFIGPFIATDGSWRLAGTPGEFG